MDIKEQQDIAKELLYKFEIIDPACILAGGAPANWYFGTPARDLDFYVYTQDNLSWMRELRINNLGLDLKQLHVSSGDEREVYACMEHLSAVYEGEYKSIKVNLMFMTERTFDSVVPKFGTSVCKIWWKGNGVRPTEEFLFSHKFKTIYKKDDYTAKVLHVEKMLSKYPDYELKDYSNYENDFIGSAHALGFFKMYLDKTITKRCEFMQYCATR